MKTFLSISIHHIQPSLHLLRTKFNLKYVSPYRAENTHRLGYKNQSVNAVQ